MSFLYISCFDLAHPIHGRRSNWTPILRVKSEKNVFSALVLFVSRPYHVNYAGFTYSI